MSNKVVSISDNPKMFLELADKEYDKGNYYLALRLVNRAISIDKYDKEALLKKAKIYSKMKLYLYSNQILFSLSLDENLKTDSYTLLSENMFKMGDIDKAMDYVSKYFSITDEDNLLFMDENEQDILISKVEAKPGEEPEIDDSFFDEKGIDTAFLDDIFKKKPKFELVYPKPPADYSKVIVQARQLILVNKIDEAIDMLNENEPEKDKTFECLNYLSFLYYIKGEFEIGIDTAKKVLKKQPENILALCNLLTFYAALGSEYEDKKQEIIEKLQSIIITDLTKLHQVAFHLSEIGEHEKAVYYYKKIISIESYDVDVMHMVAISYFNIEDFDTSLEYFSRIYTITNSPIAKYYIGLVKEQKDKKKHKKLAYTSQLPYSEMRIRVNKLAELLDKDEKDFIKVFDENSYENELVDWAFTTYRTSLKKSIILKMVKLSENYGQLEFFKEELMSIFEEKEIKEYIIELLIISYNKKPIHAVYMNELFTFKPIIPKNIDNINFSMFAGFAKCFSKLCFSEKHFENALFKIYETFESKEIPITTYEQLCALSACIAYFYNTKFHKRDLIKLFSTNSKDFNYYLALLKENDNEENN